jgi:hypothetical protein
MVPRTVIIVVELVVFGFVLVDMLFSTQVAQLVGNTQKRITTMQIPRSVLEKACADKLADKTDVKELLQFFYESQYDWFKSLSNHELLEQAEGLGLADEKTEIV